MAIPLSHPSKCRNYRLELLHPVSEDVLSVHPFILPIPYRAAGLVKDWLPPGRLREHI